jgi:hypothetical protein
MQTFSAALIDLVLAEKVDREVAANAASNRHDFLIALDRAVKEKAAHTFAELEPVPDLEPDDSPEPDPPAHDTPDEPVPPAASMPKLRVAGT